MRRHGEAFVGIDTAKARNAVAVAQSGRMGELLRYLGEFDNTPVAVGTRVTPRPPHRSERALLTHSALALDV
jgi:hypothetical protein